MTRRQKVSEAVSDSADPVPMCERAPAHTKGVTSSLQHLNTKSSYGAATVQALLQWAYAREMVHKARLPGLDAMTRMGAPRGFATAASSERIGAAVGSSMNLGFRAPRDAYAVQDAVNACGQAKLLREYALIGHAPDWTPEPEVWWEQGAAIYGRDARGRAGRRIIGYLIYLRGDLDALVAERRATYVRWAQAVGRVHAMLSAPGALLDWSLTGEPPALEPWSKI